MLSSKKKNCTDKSISSIKVHYHKYKYHTWLSRELNVLINNHENDTLLIIFNLIDISQSLILDNVNSGCGEHILNMTLRAITDSWVICFNSFSFCFFLEKSISSFILFQRYLSQIWSFPLGTCAKNNRYLTFSKSHVCPTLNMPSLKHLSLFPLHATRVPAVSQTSVHQPDETPNSSYYLISPYLFPLSPYHLLHTHITT